MYLKTRELGGHLHYWAGTNWLHSFDGDRGLFVPTPEIVPRETNKRREQTNELLNELREVSPDWANVADSVGDLIATHESLCDRAYEKGDSQAPAPEPHPPEVPPRGGELNELIGAAYDDLINDRVESASLKIDQELAKTALERVGIAVERIPMVIAGQEDPEFSRVGLAPATGATTRAAANDQQTTVKKVDVVNDISPASKGERT